MSSQINTLDARAAFETTTRPAGKSLWQRLFERLVAARQAEADRLVARYLASMSEQQRKDLGYPSGADRR